MKRVFTLVLILCGIISTQAQVDSPIIKKYSKIYEGKKYIISETVYNDGHIENYITSIPTTEMRKLKVKNSKIQNLKNIEWDEDASTEGLQISYNDIFAIQKAFNNALSQTEKQLGYPNGTMDNINLGPDFLNKSREVQSFELINKVINSLATVKEFVDLLPLEGVDKNICKESEMLAGNSLQGQSASKKKIDFRNFEFLNHTKNDAIFLTNGEYPTQVPHIQAIYNWVFADQFTGWYNRELVLNKVKDHGTKGLKDDYNLIGNEGVIGIGVNYGTVVNEIIANPTLGKALAVTMQLVDPTSNSKYAFELLNEINDTKSIGGSILAVDE